MPATPPPGHSSAVALVVDGGANAHKRGCYETPHGRRRDCHHPGRRRRSSCAQMRLLRDPSSSTAEQLRTNAVSARSLLVDGGAAAHKRGRCETPPRRRRRGPVQTWLLRDAPYACRAVGPVGEEFAAADIDGRRGVMVYATTQRPFYEPRRPPPSACTVDGRVRWVEGF